MLSRWLHVCILVVLPLTFVRPHQVFSQETANAFQRFAQQSSLQIHINDQPARTLDEWNQRRTRLRADLIKAWGGFPATDCDLEPRILGEIRRDGYRIEKVVFQTRPGILMTANAYVPDKPGKLPAILHVHGHWAGAKQDPVVQTRCIGCAKLGFFVLCVDAFGAGERAIEKKLGEYHGEMTAATLLPVGLPLAGLQVYENKRAVDYLQSRPEVDPERIGITGASGGGNQSMYAGAMDERLKCVVPTCSVGTYQSYLSAACCLCELVPGGLKFTEEGDILGLAAHRGLMVTSATRDAFQFSVGEAKKSIAWVEAIALLYPAAQIRHTIIESPHAYNQPMREAMYGWMTLHLKHEGDGSPIPDPEIQPEDPQALRCFPDMSRPDEFVTIPKFAATEARQLVASHSRPTDRAAWELQRTERLLKLTELLGGLPQRSGLQLTVNNDAEEKSQTLSFETEPHLSLLARRDLPEKPARLAIVIDLDGGITRSWSGETARRFRETGWSVVTPELRATGQFGVSGDQVRYAVDHNSSEWALWIGRPLLGQWVVDVRRTLDAIAERDGGLPREILISGTGSSGIVALCAAALDGRITSIQTTDSLATYVTDSPYRGVRLGVILPGVLRDVGDIADIAALLAPRSLTIVGGTWGAGTRLDRAGLTQQYSTTGQVYELLGATSSLSVKDSE